MKIFVGGIRDILDDRDIRELFEPYGEIEAVMHKGNYAFVFMDDADQGRQACQALHRTQVKTCTLNVEESKPSAKGDRPNFDEHKRSQERTERVDRMDSVLSGVSSGPYKPPKFYHQPGRTKLIVGNISLDTTKEDLQVYFEQLGHVHETFILEGKGVGFVHVDDMKAEDMIEESNGQNLNGSEMRVSYSASKDLKRRKDHTTRYTKLYVSPIAEEAKDSILLQRFEMFGDVKEVVIIRKSKCAFVHIDSVVVEFVMDSLNGIPFYGKPLRIQLAKGETLEQAVPTPSAHPQYAPPSGDRWGVQAVGRPTGNESYPVHHPLASMELGPGFGPNAANTKMASLPPPPVSQDELRELIEKRMKLEMVHPYEKHLIETYDGNSKNTPQHHPPPEYLRLVRDRAILKVRLLRAQERGFDVYGTATQMYTQGTDNAADPYGFGGSSVTPQPPQKSRTATLYDPQSAPAAQHDNVQYGNPPPMTNGAAPPSSYATAYANSQAGGPMMKKEFMPRRSPY